MNLEEMEKILKRDKTRLNEIISTPIDKRTKELGIEGGQLRFWNDLLEEEIEKEKNDKK